MLQATSTDPVQERLSWIANYGESFASESISELIRILALPSLLPADELQALRLLAWFRFWSGDTTEAQSLIEQVLAKKPPLSQRMDVLLLRALVVDRGGDSTRAIVELQALVGQCRTHNMIKDLAKHANSLGFILGRCGQLEQGLVLHLEALRSARMAGVSREEATALMNIGTIHQRQGRIQEAKKFWTDALERAEQGGFLKIEAICRNNLAVQCELVGDLDRAFEHHTRSLQIKEQLNNRVGRAMTLNNMGFICFRLRRLEEAMNYFQQADTEADALHLPWLKAYVIYGISMVFKLSGDFEKALDYAVLSLDLRRQLNSAELTVASLVACCDAILDQQDKNHPKINLVHQWFYEVELLSRSAPASDIQSEVCRVGARYARLMGREQDAIEYEHRQQTIQAGWSTLATK